MLDDATARNLALELGLQFEEADFDALAPLVDASLVWLEDDARSEIAASVAEELWPRELREDIERGLERVSTDTARRRRDVAAARRDLAAGPRASRLARAVVDQAADERAFDLQLPVGCPHCIDEGIGRGDTAERRESALLYAKMAGHAARIPRDEIRAALAAPTPALELATDERRTEVRWWLRRIAFLGQESMPNGAAALRELLDDDELPPVEDDAIWRAAVAGLAAQLRLAEGRPLRA